MNENGLIYSENLNNSIYENSDNISKIEEFLKSLKTKYGFKEVLSLDDEEKECEKIFVIKIPKSTSVEKRGFIHEKIIEEGVNFAKNKGLLDTFMKTTIFIMR
ncbi:MAG: hypothetical protein ACRC1M_06760 [Methanobacteriaceae archaeon]